MASQREAQDRKQSAPATTPTEEGDLLYLGYAREFAAARKLEGARKSVRLLCRLFIRLLGGYLCNLDLESSRAREARRPRGRRRNVCGPCEGSSLRPLELSEWKRRQRFGWIYWASFLWFVASLVLLSVYAYFQYRYDIDLLRLEALDRLEARHIDNPEPANRTQIVAHMAQSGRVLRVLGADFMHLTILVESFFVIIIILTTVITVPALVHYRFQRPFDQYHLVRELVDRQRENETLRRMVERQVGQFVASSREFYQNILNFQSGTTSTSGGGEQSSLGLALRRELRVRRAVREMLAAGALTPLFKLRPWAKWAYVMLLGLFLLIGQGIFFAYVGLIYGFFSQSNPASNSLSWHILLACLGPLAFTASTVVVHPPVVIVATQEQIQYVAQLRRMIKRCIELNSALVARSAARHQRMRGDGESAPGGRTREELDETLNSNMLFVLLHYKIFVAQLRPLRSSLGLVNNIALSLLLLWPTLTRLHQPYLVRLNISWLSSSLLKTFALAISTSVLAQANVVSAPVCYLFARCKDLYRDLASLAAHLSEAKLAIPAGAGAALYDAHAENCLLLEIADSRRFLELLTVRAAGISGTYAALVRALFWYGIALISILAENSCTDKSEQTITAFLNDPLGVYSQIKCT